MLYQSKDFYRTYFANVKQFLKMNYFLKNVCIEQSNFSRFLKGKEYDYLFSVERLDRIYQEIINTLKIT